MVALILSLPAWAIVIGIIGLMAAMIYILFGGFRGRH
jgi:hypothetical protein